MNDNIDGKAQLAEYIGSFSRDPLSFVLACFPWGKGELKNYEGPDEWQKDVLRQVGEGLIDISDVNRIAVSSGNGIGKSALVSWIVLWSISTFEDTRGIVTANTETQLRTKTWPEVTKWHRLFIGKDLFNIAAMSIFSTQKEHEKTWRIDAIPWSRENPEAFAGLHNQGKRTLVIFDEASAIDDEIWRTVTGAIMDANTEIIWCAFGNPTRPNGYFYECFNRFSHRWKNRQIDSRTVKISNKKELEGWVEDYGIDSDYVRVHVLGQFPVAGENQLISHDLAQEALHRRSV